MGLNDAELERVVVDLQRLVGAPAAGAWQPRRDRVIIGLGTAMLLLVPRGPHARLHTIGRRPRNPQRPFSFQGAARSHLGGRLVALRRKGGDRVVELVFDRGSLHLRLTGRSGGLWLLDGDRVLAAYDGPAPAALPPLAERPPVRAAEPRFLPRNGEDWDGAAGRFFGAAEDQDRLRQLRVEVGRGLRRELDRSRRLELKLAEDLDRASRAPFLRRQADALAAALHTISRGSTHAILPDLEDPGHTWNVELDPSKPAAASMERMYRQARRLDRAADQVLERLDAAESRTERMEAALEEVETGDGARLREIRALLPTKGGRQADGTLPPFVQWNGPRGQTVLVGRNAAANRRLTFQTARGRDWWMHVRGRPGAHVVIRMARPDTTPDLPLLLSAAQIALVHAKVPEGGSAEVQYTRVRDVRSIPGEAAGRVRLAHEKVLYVTRDAKALEKWTRGD